MKLTHIIAASPSGMVSQPHDDDRSGSSRAGTNSAGRPEARKPTTSFNATTRRAIEAELRAGCNAKLREDRHVTVGGPLLARVTRVDAIVMLLAAAFIGALLATGGAL